MKGIILLTAVSFILLGCASPQTQRATPQGVYITATPRVAEVTATPEPTAPSLAAQTAIIVLQGNPPAIDGTISPVEWDDASIETFADGSELLLMHAGGYLYLGVRANTPGMIVGNVFINRGDEIAILHSSAALGTAIYQKGEDNWRQIQNFTWQCRDTSDSESAQAERAEFLLEEGWVAANSRMGTPEELEYRIEMAEDTLRLAVNFIRASNPNEKIPCLQSGNTLISIVPSQSSNHSFRNCCRSILFLLCPLIPCQNG